ATPAHLAQHETMVSPRDRSAGSPNSFRRPQSRFESVEGVPGCAQPAHAGPHRLAEQLTTFTSRFHPCVNRLDRDTLFTAAIPECKLRWTGTAPESRQPETISHQACVL